MSYRKVSGLSSIVFLSVAVWAGCSASGGTGSEVASDAPATTPTDDTPNQLPPSQSSVDSGPAKDSGPTDAGKPKKDASAPIDSGVPTPDPGATCKTESEIFSRQCGACGTQEAACIAGVVTDYSPCANEVGECVPGRVENQTCGNCGTNTRTCNQFCAWNTSACTGEPVNSCVAGTLAWSAAGCGVGVVRSRGCDVACNWSPFTPACTTPAYALTVGTAAGAVSNAIVPILTATHTKKVQGSCKLGATLSATDDHAVSWVRVTNNGSKKANLSVWTATAPGGPAVLDTSLVAYMTQPSTDDELKACLVGVGETCNTATLPCGDSAFGSLTGTNALGIPAGESRVVGVVISAVAGQATSGPVTVSVRVDSLE